ncbi:MAG: hypothetical protein JW738_00040 [Actinobacteria bacterium]|nr:hypothetical protein [Actinomycetota bacterium]
MMAKKAQVIKNKRGTAVKIDLEQLESLRALQCTDEEIAAFFKCTRRTIVNRKRNPAFREAYERGGLRGKVSLRRLMWQKAEGKEAEFLIDNETSKIVRDDKGRAVLKTPGVTPDTTMQIWLSKNMLGYVDKVEHTGKDGKPVEVDLDAKGKLLSILNSQSSRNGKTEGDQQSNERGSSTSSV